MTPLLVGLGVDELSVGPHDLAPVRKALLSLDFGRCQEMAAKALTLGTSREIFDCTKAMAKEAYPDLLEGLDAV